MIILHNAVTFLELSSMVFWLFIFSLLVCEPPSPLSLSLFSKKKSGHLDCEIDYLLSNLMVLPINVLQFNSLKGKRDSHLSFGQNLVWKFLKKEEKQKIKFKSFILV